MGRSIAQVRKTTPLVNLGQPCSRRLEQGKRFGDFAEPTVRDVTHHDAEKGNTDLNIDAMRHIL